MKSNNTKVMKSEKRPIANTIVRIIMYLWTVIVLFPVIWTVYSSFKENKQFYANPWALPDVYHFENYKNAWVLGNISDYFMNSVVVVVVCVALTLLFSAASAYVIAKFKFKGKNAVRYLYMIALYIPQMVYIIPLFFFVDQLKLSNSIPGLILVYTVLLGVPTGILQLVAFFKNIPNSIIEAARIDGCSEFGVFFRVVMPLVVPGLATVVILTSLLFWNEYAICFIFISDPSKYTIPVGINALATTFQYRTDFGALFAGLVIGMIPITALYMIFQKQLEKGVMLGSGVKG